MRTVIQLLLGATASLALAAPAYAAASVTLPEPNALTLLSLGVTGLIIGRRAAQRKRRD